MSDSNNRRRRYWINPSFQARYLLRVLALQLITMAATAIVSVMLAFMLLSPHFSAGPQWRGIIGSCVALACVLGCVVAWLGVRLSHKICGPVYRVITDLKAFREGASVRPIKLRDGDEFHELATAINDAISSLASPAQAESRPLAASETANELHPPA